MPTDTRTARTWAEVNLGRVAGNVRAIERLTGGDVVMAVVKADAYGHGAVRIARTCAQAGVTHFGVAALDEAVVLRQAGIAGDIHLLSPFLPHEADALIRTDVIPMISSIGQWNAFARAAVPAPLPARCFLKVDTGMGRSGCSPDEARALWHKAMGAVTNLRVVGIATHLSSADEPDAAPSRIQTDAFSAFLRTLGPLDRAGGDGRGGQGVWLSWANSPAALRFGRDSPLPPGTRGVLIRAGLLLYGIEPFRGALFGQDIEPILSWKARVTLLRALPAGATIGYNRTHTLARASRVATLAVGYGDGFPRRLSDRGHVLLHGRLCPLLGRVSMDQCQVDVTEVPGVALGDVATLLGTDGAASQTAFDLAEQIDTTPHEPTCALSQRVPRIYRCAQSTKGKSR